MGRIPEECEIFYSINGVNDYNDADVMVKMLEPLFNSKNKII
jgi:hypothetical protein